MITCRLGCVFAIYTLLAGYPLVAKSLVEKNEQLLQQLVEVHDLTAAAEARVRAILARSGIAGQGNPAISEHPLTPEQCRTRLEDLRVQNANAAFERICDAKHMAPLYDSSVESAENAKVCIDQFEFPNIACAYPVTWVRAKEAAEICSAMGKRICDAHEWEGACAGRLEPADYRFDLAANVSPRVAVKRMREVHNNARAGDKTWSYGPAYSKGTCAAGSRKTPGCEGGSWSKCGTNTYPTGAFPDCRSSLGVYDLHGNVAEHMNLPLTENQMANRGSKTLGHTEMKGSWFIFDSYRAHQDWCRWRAPYWHGSKVMHRKSHANYHLGFRCCKTLSSID
ncbi:MAG: SUMF1/EgtB/PvdO family nonheme iron enzyme [Geminicoccaceae bacterium]